MMKGKEKGRYYFAMKQTPLKQISVQLKRLLCDARLCALNYFRKGKQALFEKTQGRSSLASELPFASDVNVTSNLQTTFQRIKAAVQNAFSQGKEHPVVVVICVCALVVSCLAAGVSCAFVDRTSANSEMESQKSVLVNDDPLISLKVGDSAIAERLGGFSVAQQGVLHFSEEGGVVFAQIGDTAVQEAVTDLFITISAIQGISSSEEALEAFSLIEGMSEESDELLGDELAEAIRALESQGYEVGCFFMNLDSGKGVSYNLDTRIYGASSFKGIYAAYLSEHLADGEVGLSSSAISLMNASVRYSDNTAFSTLRNSYDGAGFAGWIESCGVNSDIVNDTHFPRYSARESALLWFHTYQYLQTGTEAANHLRELFTQTNVSFIREGVTNVLSSDNEMSNDAASEERDESEESALNTDAVVLNKAGWIASTPRFSGLCDAGLIEYDGQTYLISVMTSAPDSTSHRDQVIEIAEELFKAR